MASLPERAMKKLGQLVDAAHIALELRAHDVPSCLDALVRHLLEQGDIPEELVLKMQAALMDREELGGTCLGGGVAVPHAYFEGMSRSVVVIGRFATPVDFGAPDGLPVDIVFLLAGPPEAQRQHIKLLARIARLLHDPGWPGDLRAAATPEDVLVAIRSVESRRS
jgi:mannitol/fructose-specific phosphotransferase system IIA component (Ntr-type)